MKFIGLAKLPPPVAYLPSAYPASARFGWVHLVVPYYRNREIQPVFPVRNNRIPLKVISDDCVRARRRDSGEGRGYFWMSYCQ